MFCLPTLSVTAAVTVPVCPADVTVGQVDLTSAVWCRPTGISGKSQILFALVFTTRYLDLLTSFISLYNTCMKVREHWLWLALARPSDNNWRASLTQVIYIGCAYATVYLIYMKFRATYDGNHDSFRMEFLIVPVGGLAVLVNHDFSFLEVSSASELRVAVGPKLKIWTNSPAFAKKKKSSTLISRLMDSNKSLNIEHAKPNSNLWCFQAKTRVKI